MVRHDRRGHDQAAESPAGDPVHIGANDYTVREITFGELAEALTQQNAYRATLGLPPLPDLTTVTHDNPATAPPKKE